MKYFVIYLPAVGPQIRSPHNVQSSPRTSFRFAARDTPFCRICYGIKGEACILVALSARPPSLFALRGQHLVDELVDLTARLVDNMYLSLASLLFGTGMAIS